MKRSARKLLEMRLEDANQKVCGWASKSLHTGRGGGQRSSTTEIRPENKSKIHTMRHSAAIWVFVLHTRSGVWGLDTGFANICLRLSSSWQSHVRPFETILSFACSGVVNGHAGACQSLIYLQTCRVFTY
jgi:hypothetical protein